MFNKNWYIFNFFVLNGAIRLRARVQILWNVIFIFDVSTIEEILTINICMHKSMHGAIIYSIVNY